MSILFCCISDNCFVIFVRSFEIFSHGSNTVTIHNWYNGDVPKHRGVLFLVLPTHSSIILVIYCHYPLELHCTCIWFPQKQFSADVLPRTFPLQQFTKRMKCGHFLPLHIRWQLLQWVPLTRYVHFIRTCMSVCVCAVLPHVCVCVSACVTLFVCAKIHKIFKI